VIRIRDGIAIRYEAWESIPDLSRWITQFIHRCVVQRLNQRDLLLRPGTVTRAGYRFTQTSATQLLQISTQKEHRHPFPWLSNQNINYRIMNILIEEGWRNLSPYFTLIDPEEKLIEGFVRTTKDIPKYLVSAQALIRAAEITNTTEDLKLDLWWGFLWHSGMFIIARQPKNLIFGLKLASQKIEVSSIVNEYGPTTDLSVLDRIVRERRKYCNARITSAPALVKTVRGVLARLGDLREFRHGWVAYKSAVEQLDESGRSNSGKPGAGDQ